jgi:hypothetical protein
MTQHSHARCFLTPAVADEIFRRISEGEPLIQICGPNREAGLPDRVTVYKRIREDKDFRRAYLVAREAQAATLAEEIVQIADGRLPEPGQEPNVGRDWLRVSSRQWYAGVLAPRTYGGRRFIRDELAEMEAADGAVEMLSDREAAAQIAAILESARIEQLEEEEAEAGLAGAGDRSEGWGMGGS